MWIEVFKTGTWTDSAGNTRTWTEEDLDKIVASYNPAEHEAPVVIGHPKDNAPAFGWVEALKREGNVLKAKLKQLVPEFVEMVKKGLFKKRSISLYPDLRLRHIGFLGAQPPAVKGLADVQFGDQEAQEIEWAFEEAATGGNPNKPTNQNQGGSMDPFKEFQEELNALKQQLASYQEALKKKDDELAATRQQLEQLAADKRRMSYENFVDGLIDSGKILPANRELVILFMETMEGAGELEFQEGDTIIKKPLLEVFQEFLQSLPAKVHTGPMRLQFKEGDDDKNISPVQKMARAIREGS